MGKVQWGQQAIQEAAEQQTMAAEALKRKRLELATTLCEIQARTKRMHMPRISRRQTVVGIAEDGQVEFGHDDAAGEGEGDGDGEAGGRRRQEEQERLAQLMQQGTALAQQAVELEAK